MKAEWLFDARKIPDEVMNYVRRIAVQAIEEKHYSPELVADLFGISRSSIYDWLNLVSQWWRTRSRYWKSPRSTWGHDPRH